MTKPKKRGRVKGRHELTSRDLDLVQFLEQTKLYITSDQASRLFYGTGKPLYSLKNAQNRLRILCEELKEIKRFREYNTQSYAYYIKSVAPRMHKHKLANTEFLSYFVLIPGVEVDVGKSFHNDAKYCHLLDEIVKRPHLQELFPQGRTFIVNVCDRPPKASFPLWWVKHDMTGLDKIEKMLRGEHVER